jgi:hypothetical protein
VASFLWLGKVEATTHHMEIVRNFSAVSDHGQKPLCFLLLLVVFAVAANSSGRKIMIARIKLVLISPQMISALYKEICMFIKLV